MHYTTYILYSSSEDHYYIGFTGNEIREHVKEYNSSMKEKSGKKGDWKLVYQERFESKSEALVWERMIKSWNSRKMIEKLIRTQKL